MIKNEFPPISFTSFEQQIAVKMVLDLRYYCTNNIVEESKINLSPVTKLPIELASMIAKSGIGGIVLFRENLVTTDQIIDLIDDMQIAALQSNAGKPLIISIDQEGGRVVRLPEATSFSGNMAIGATYQANGTKFASETSIAIAKELDRLGINNNYAPVIDVNINANNPVINTRSFGENPQLVAELGAAAVSGFQQQGIMATLKHFPGHGDTQIDSHLDLPLVDHDLKTIEKNDLKPFVWAIEHCDPAMIMTAHIQYPALDNSTINSITGEKILRPATMSRKILTGILRNKMGYNGLIATDALDMAGISHYFNNVSAVVEAFVAGADLALMPFRIRKKEDINKFYMFIKEVALGLQHKVKEDNYCITEITDSVNRINRYKSKYIQLNTSLPKSETYYTDRNTTQKKHLALEQSLANNSVVLLTNQEVEIPLIESNIAHIHLFVINNIECEALKNSIEEHWKKMGFVAPNISATVIIECKKLDDLELEKHLVNADLLIATIDTKKFSAVDIGGVEDASQQERINFLNENYKKLLIAQLNKAQSSNVKSALIAKGSPYLLKPYNKIADSILVIFEDRIYFKNNKKLFSPGYQTSINILFGQQKALGKLPISLFVD